MATRTRPFLALRHAFEVRSTDADLVAYVDRTLAPLAAGAQPVGSTIYRLVVGQDGRHRLFADGELLREARYAARVLDHLLWHVNQEAVRRTGDRVTLHAAAVARDGVGVLLPAEMEAGKTTLTAKLIERGYAYLSDELAPLDPVTLAVEAYPKPLSIDAGSWQLLGHLRPAVPDVAICGSDRWHVVPTDIPGGRVIDSMVPAVIVCPRYEAGAPTVVSPMASPDLVVHLMGQTFRPTQQLARDFRVLTRLGNTVPGYRLTGGDLDAACAAVDEVVDRALDSRGGGRFTAPAYVRARRSLDAEGRRPDRRSPG